MQNGGRRALRRSQCMSGPGYGQAKEPRWLQFARCARDAAGTMRRPVMKNPARVLHVGRSTSAMRALILLIFLLTPGCQSPVEPEGAEPIPPPATATVPGGQPTPDPPATDTSAAPDDPASRPQSNVILDQPQDGTTLTENPMVVRGRARTFENHVEIRVENAAGRTIKETFATARGELGSFNPFEKEIFFVSDPGESVTITLIERSAKDGSIRTTDSSRVRVDIPKKPVTLYFPTQKGDPNDCSAVESVVRNLPVSVAAARLALEALIAGPTRAERVIGATNPFPEGVEIRSVNLRNGTLTVDFNESLGNVGGSCRALAIRASVEKTLRAIEGVDRVLITAMGEEATALQP